jgi:peroxiredoxin
MRAEGQAAPDFKLPDQNGEQVSLSDLRGQTVVIT